MEDWEKEIREAIKQYDHLEITVYDQDKKYLSVIDSLRAENLEMKKRLELAEKYLGEQGLSLDAYIKFHEEG